MRYLAAVVFLASCAMLTPVPLEDRTIEQSAPAADQAANPAVDPEVKRTVDPEQSERRPEIRKPKLKAQVPPLSEVSSCANVDAGNLKETIKAKLDCIKENAK